MRIWALILHLSHLSKKKVSNILEAEKRRNVENKVPKGKKATGPENGRRRGLQDPPTLTSLS